MITKIVIRNYRIFRDFEASFVSGVNVVVGANESGKSTLVEAINLALTGRVNGRLLAQEFSPFLMNLQATKDYVQALREAGDPTKIKPPEVVVDLFLKDDDTTAELRGRNNLLDEDACGLRVRGYFSSDFQPEYNRFVEKPEEVRLVPTEYYQVEWRGFSGNAVTARSVPATASVIDPTTIRFQSGADYHLQQILRTHLEPKERAELSRQYRTLREEFGTKEEVKKVNTKLAGEEGEITDKKFELSVDLSQRYTWEQSLTAHLDELPFPFIGKGEQNAVKTLLAIGRKAEGSHVVLIEEPENHASFAALRRLMKRIEDRCADKQVIIATHSSFVLNKLGLDRLILLSGQGATRLTALPDDTVKYFRKLSGYDTLRLVLADKVILVEGPSDELVVQRAYRDKHDKDPIDAGVDVINVRGLSFKRFLDLAILLGRRVAVVTDNDEKPADEVRARYKAYSKHDCVSIHVGEDPKLKTLEPQIAAVNDLALLNRILDKDFPDEDSLLDHMKDNKTASALAIYEAGESITMPNYIQEALLV